MTTDITIDAVFFAQTHVLQPTAPFFKLGMVVFISSLDLPFNQMSCIKVTKYSGADFGVHDNESEESMPVVPYCLPRQLAIFVHH